MKESNRRIVKNTIILYGRSLLTMVIGLYTGRIMIDALGIDNYGIQNVVGGIVALTGLISGALTVSSGRFISCALGEGDFQKMKNVFATTMNLQIIIALIVTIALETGGLWFLNSEANIPTDRMYAANVVLQCSIASTFIGLATVPYGSVLVAHEKFGIYAYLTIAEVLIKLLTVITIANYGGDRLILLAILNLITFIILNIFKIVYIAKVCPEARYKVYLDRSTVKEMASFSGWAFWGNCAVLVKDQSVTLVMNVFCGLVANAARGVATTISGAVGSLIGNFLTSINPQIIKTCSSGRIEEMSILVMRSSKMSFMLLFLFAFPVCVNISPLLHWWLVEVPDYATSFTVLILIYNLVSCINTPLFTALIATGKIKKYEIALTITYFTNFALSYLALRIGMEPESVYVLNIIFKAIVGQILLWQLSEILGFNSRLFLKEVILRCLLVALIATIIYLALSFIHIEGLFQLSLSSILYMIVIGSLELYVGFTKTERQFIFNFIQRKLQNSRHYVAIKSKN